jgi:hypothetical protein
LLAEASVTASAVTSPCRALPSQSLTVGDEYHYRV